MVEKARVISVNGQTAKVQLKRSSACGDGCASCKGGCAPTNTVVEATNKIGANIGQEVEVEMNTKIFMNAILLNYGLPLVMLVIGMFAGSYLHNAFSLNISSDLLSVFLGFGLMTISYLVVNRIDKGYKKSGKVELNIINII